MPGTPGVGKSRLAEHLSAVTGLEWINVGKVAEQHNCYEEYDEEYQCQVLDEDKLLDILEERVSQGGTIVDYHGSDFFPKRWFDRVYVLRTEIEVLNERLSSRGYSEKKLQDNLQCEIFQTILEETRESYDEDIIEELPSNSEQDFQNNVRKVMEYMKSRQN